MPRGGPRPGAGRKSKAEELRVRDMAIDAVVKYYGSIEDGLIALLQSGEPGLQKFVFEHAIGKPTEKVHHSGDISIPVVFQLDPKFGADKD